MDGMGDMDLSSMMGGAPPEDDFSDDDIEYDDLEVGEEKDVSKNRDGGCLKKVLAKGTGDDRPEKGAEVTVHYTGTLLDGTKFDSSVDRGDPFKFKLGVGQVIKGWDQGVASMKKGEKCVLTCAPEYAYGARGSPPTIPADATLKFEVELFSWKSDNDLFDDGGCLRVKTLQKSSNYGFPKDADEVTVAYAVTAPDDDVAGAGDAIATETDATFAVKDAPFVGLGAVLRKMKEGESVRYKMKNVPGGTQYLEGVPAGAAAAPPQAADVVVTLKKLCVVEAICDGLGTKKTVTEGEGWDRPNDGATCVVSVSANGAPAEALTFKTGDEAVASGLEECVMLMKQGEVAEARVPAACAGSFANAAGGADAVTLAVTLTSFEKEKDVWSMTNGERVEAGEATKAAGNDAYKAGKLELAERKYDKALRFVEHDQSFSDDEKKETKKIKLSLYLNGAAVSLKRKKWKDASESAGKALDLDAGNEKALYRRAQAFVEVEEYDEARRDVRKLLEGDDKHREGRALLQRIKKLEAAQMKKDAKTFGGMFAKLGGLYAEEEKRAGPDGEGFDPAKASGDAMEPVDIGGGFTMEEVTGEPEGEPEGDVKAV